MTRSSALPVPPSSTRFPPTAGPSPRRARGRRDCRRLEDRHQTDEDRQRQGKDRLRVDEEHVPPRTCRRARSGPPRRPSPRASRGRPARRGSPAASWSSNRAGGRAAERSIHRVVPSVSASSPTRCSSRRLGLVELEVEQAVGALDRHEEAAGAADAVPVEDDGLHDLAEPDGGDGEVVPAEPEDRVADRLRDEHGQPGAGQHRATVCRSRGRAAWRCRRRCRSRRRVRARSGRSRPGCSRLWPARRRGRS